MWTEKEIRMVKELYLEDSGYKKMSEIIGRTTDALFRKLVRIGVANRRGRGGKGTGQKDYFVNIDKPIIAYLLGFIAADGYVTRKKNVDELSVEINEKDREIIDILKSEIGGRICFIKNKKAIRFTVTGRFLVDSLMKYSIIERKSTSIRIKNIPASFHRFFILGYSDGDGCIFLSNRSIGWTLTSGSPGFLEDVKNIIKRNIGVILSAPRNTHGNTFELRCHGNIKAKSVLDWLYDNHNLGLKRKRALYGHHLESI